MSLLLLAVVVLAGCQGQSILDAVFPQKEEVPGNSPPVPSSDDASKIEPIPTPAAPKIINLTIWIPEQFDLNGESNAARLLYQRIHEFSNDNPQVHLDVRVKSTTGAGSILETLAAASAVAPNALPSLILISRSDLVQAASKNLLFPIESFTEITSENDWFDISRELGKYQGTMYCFPFAVNAIGLVQENARLGSDQPTWEDMIRQSDQLLFASGDPEALTTLALYQSAGGILTDSTGQPYLDSNALNEVLSAYNDAAKRNRLSGSVLDYQTDGQVWDDFLNTTNSSALTWSNHALADPVSFQLALLPSLGDEPFTYAGGWVWCLTEPQEQERIYSVSFAEFLSAPEFLAEWAPESGYLPVRPSSVTGFSNIELQSTISKMLLSTRVRPDKNAISEIGAEIKTSISEVLQQQFSPEESALNAVKRLEATKSQ